MPDSNAPAAPTTPPLPPLPPPPPRRRWRSLWLTLLITALLVGSALWLVWRTRAPTGAAGLPAMGAPPGGGVTVGTAQARAGELPVLIDALGTVTPPATALLVPQVAGVLTEVLFTEGQMVRKGQVLARIDARPYEQQLAQARAQRARDEAQLAPARVTLERYRQLLQQDSIARQDVDTQAALVQQLEAAVQADRASEAGAALNLSHTTLAAPLSGRIGLRSVDPGNLVGTSTTAGIASITQITPIDVVFAVPQERVQAVLAAQKQGVLPVAALDSGRRRTLAQGRFLTLDNQINTATGQVRAKARFANEDGALFPNQFVNARLQLGHERGLLVPVTAVRTGPQGDYVYVVDAERVARMRAVTRGMAGAQQVLIAEGLQPGETVVTEGGDRVKDGGKVMLARTGPPAAKGGQAGSGGAQRAAGAPAPGGAAAASGH